MGDGGRHRETERVSPESVFHPIKNSAPFLRHAKEENCVSCGGGAVEIISTSSSSDNMTEAAALGSQFMETCCFLFLLYYYH